MAYMDKSAADAFIYSKASGILGKSFIGNKAAQLFSAGNLSSLWTLLFNSPVPQIPEMLLTAEIEKEAFNRFISQYTSFVGEYAKPDEIFIANNHIAIDCASGYGGKVGCIRLDDFKCFYSM